jgi:arylsulfatase A-like enzyme
MSATRALGGRLVLLAAGVLAACGEAPPPERPLELLALPYRVLARGAPPDLANPVSLQGEARPSLLLPTPSEVRFRVRLPPRPVLTFALGIKPLPGGGETPRVKARFTVHAGEDAPRSEVYRRDLPAGRADEWIEQSADLRRFAGREVWLALGHSLVTEDGRSPPAEVAPALLPLFAEPVLHDRAQYGQGKGVLVISVDTLRRDHLSLYGYRRRTSPALDALAEEAVVFDDAVSTSSWTLPAHASLLTSLYPSAHGAVKLEQGLPPGLPSLQAALGNAGWFTQAMVTHLYLGAPYGFAEGFHRHRLFSDMRAKELTDRAIGFLRARGDGDYFLFLHYYDPHWHYDPPPPFNRTFDPGYQGRATGVWWDFKKETRESLAPRDLAHVVALYDGEIRYTDSQLARIFAEMKKLGLFRSATIVLLSDHGEEFLDHGSWEHQKTLYEEQLRIPLLIKLPAGEGAGRRVRHQVRLIDVAPTLLEILGLPAPGSFQGRSLVDLVRGGTDFPTEAWAETEHTVDGSHKLALRRGAARNKWILSYREHSPPGLELYRLGEDPGETRNLAPSEGAEVRDILARAESFLSDARRRRTEGPAPSRPALTPEMLERLRALGYVQ